MEDTTKLLIYSLKYRNGADYDEVVRSFKEKYEGKPKNFYADNQLDYIAADTLVDFLKTADNPDQVVKDLLRKINIHFLKENTITPYELRCFIFELLEQTQVYGRNGHYINGFAPYKLTQFEYDFLRECRSNFPKYIFIARNKDNSLNLYQILSNKVMSKSSDEWCDYAYKKPIVFSNMFNFIKFEDEEPHLVNNILAECQIISTNDSTNK